MAPAAVEMVHTVAQVMVKLMRVIQTAVKQNQKVTHLLMEAKRQALTVIMTHTAAVVRILAAQTVTKGMRLIQMTG